MNVRDLILRAALAMAAAAVSLPAAPPLSTIRDTIYKADGTRFTGTVIIEWRSFDAADTSFIGRQRLQLNVVDGFLNVRLVPTTNASTSAWYLVKYVSGGNMQFSEAWAVPPSDQQLRIRNVRIADPLLGPGAAGGATTIEIGDVQGLQAELDLRAKKAITYSSSRAVVINLDGELDGAVGDPFDCVRVDGSAGPCGSGSGGSGFGNFVDSEVPSGPVDGSNTAFTLSQTPSPASSLLVYRNGVLQKRFLDFTLTGNAIQFDTAAVPQLGDVLLASYRTAGTGSVPQVLCSATGTATSQTSFASLGTCVIPANTLRAGDRLELSFDYSHEGGSVGFQYEVRWGSSVIATRAAAAATSMATGRASVAIHTTAAQWSAQSWGANLSLTADLGSATENLANAITVDFRGLMAAATTETVTLRNFTVTRLPAP